MKCVPWSVSITIIYTNCIISVFACQLCILYCLLFSLYYLLSCCFIAPLFIAMICCIIKFGHNNRVIQRSKAPPPSPLNMNWNWNGHEAWNGRKHPANNEYYTFIHDEAFTRMEYHFIILHLTVKKFATILFNHGGAVCSTSNHKPYPHRTFLFQI